MMKLAIAATTSMYVNMKGFASTDTAIHYNLPVEEPMAVRKAFFN